MNCRYLDAESKSRVVVMGCYGIGISRIAAACVEQNHDAKGILWPPQVAPFHAHLVGLNLEDPAVRDHADQVYQRLQAERIEVLYDDRLARAGEKFSDADLIGLPVRLTVSKRTAAEGKIEFKLRAAPNPELCSLDDAIRQTRATCGLD
jgi:prolyl-tRNA synthetase